MILLHYITEDDVMHVEAFDTLKQAEAYMKEHDVVYDYTLIEGEILEMK